MPGPNIPPQAISAGGGLKRRAHIKWVRANYDDLTVELCVSIEPVEANGSTPIDTPAVQRYNRTITFSADEYLDPVTYADVLTDGDGNPVDGNGDPHPTAVDKFTFFAAPETALTAQISSSDSKQAFD